MVNERRDETASQILAALEVMQGALDAIKDAAEMWLATSHEEGDDAGRN